MQTYVEESLPTLPSQSPLFDQVLKQWDRLHVLLGNESGVCSGFLSPTSGDVCSGIYFCQVIPDLFVIRAYRGQRSQEEKRADPDVSVSKGIEQFVMRTASSHP